MPRRSVVVATIVLALTLAGCSGGPGGDVDARPVDAVVGDGDPDPIDAGSDAATDAGLDAPTDAAVDAPDEEALPALAGGLATLSGASSAGNYDGARGFARFSNPVNLVSDGAGGALVCDFDNGRIRHVSADGAVTTPITVPSTFARPFGVVRDGDTLFVQTDRSTVGTNTGALWRITLSTGTTALVRDGFGRYRGLGLLADGRLVGVEYLQHVVSVIDRDTGVATVLAGVAGQPGNVDDTGAAARFRQPWDVVVLPGDELVISDLGNHTLRRVTAAGAVTTWVGDGTAGGDDGTGAAARFNGPQGLAVDGDGNVYVSDPENANVRRVTPAGVVTTIAGTGTPGYLDASDPLTGQLFGLEGLDLSADGAYLFIADGSRGEANPHHRVRRLSLP